MNIMKLFLSIEKRSSYGQAPNHLIMKIIIITQRFKFVPDTHVTFTKSKQQ